MLSNIRPIIRSSSALPIRAFSNRFKVMSRQHPYTEGIEDVMKAFDTNMFPFRMSGVPDPLRSVTRAFTGGLAPADVRETNDCYQIIMDVPGVDRENIKIVIKSGKLFVSGERIALKEEMRDYHIQERLSGKFERVFELPPGCDVSTPAAKFNNGVLTIEIKKNETADERTVEISE
eukprot:GHVL01040657.1.p1 GENE.GHVL01040657.1~~GHVL01040657.1.p1  ORF type:complete len:187 (+),score=38.60 GHVL01040657.1:34-561(+)